MDVLRDRLDFFVATDALKAEQRSNWIRCEPRFETVAEHVWHATLLAMLFADAAPDGTDHNKVRDLLTVHDLVEVYAGDVPVWDQSGQDGIEHREWDAGEKLTALLPEDVRARIDPLWQEFQRQETLEARFARAIDALHPMIVSWYPPAIGHKGAAQLTAERIIDRKRPDIAAFPQLWELAQWLVLQAIDQGFLQDDGTRSRLILEGVGHGN